MEVNSDWLEVLMNKHAKDNSVEKVLEVTSTPVVSKGDNYCSEMRRVKMRVLLGSGKESTRCLIIKEMPDSELRVKQLTEWGLFKREIKMFREVLPLMADLMAELEDCNEPLWGKCLEYRPYDRLVLEDLRELGYKMADRREGLDLAHTLVVMNGLGRYHAMSVVLRDRGLLETSEFSTCIFTQANDLIKLFQKESFEILAKVIDTTWGPEWSEYSKKLRDMSDKAHSMLLEVVNAQEGFKVLNHGDCWVNNMLFKYTPFSDVPVSLRFLDFQLPYFSSYCYDLTYFLNTSAKEEVLNGYLDQVLEAYHRSLHRTFELFNHKDPSAPTLEQIKSEVDSFAILSLVLGVTTMTFMMTEPEDVLEIEDLLKDFEGKQSFSLKEQPFLGKVYTKKIKHILRWYKEKGFFE